MNLINHSHPDPQRAFERDFARATLVSERKRATILSAVLALMLSNYLAALLLFSDLLDMVPPDARRWGPLLLAAGLCYTLLARLVFGLYARSGRQPPPLSRYANVLLETSLPTLGLILVAWLVGPLPMLLGPISYTYFLFIVLSALRLNFRLSLFTGVVAAAEYAALSLAYLDLGQPLEAASIHLHPLAHLARSGVMLASGVLAGLVGRELKARFLGALRTVEERNRVVQMFGQHVSPAVVDKLLAQPADLPSEVRSVCLMFLDIRDFTTFSETRSPTEVVDYLNALFAFMIEIVNRHHGIINKFLGDGFMAVFGAPLSDGLDSQNALAAAREIVRTVEELNQAGRIPPTRIGIGLHTGEAVTGQVGSPLRKEYTIIGDTVNLAARIEQLNKQYGSSLLISEAVWAATGEACGDAVALPPVLVKGRHTPVQIYRLA